MRMDVSYGQPPLCIGLAVGRSLRMESVVTDAADAAPNTLAPRRDAAECYLGARWRAAAARAPHRDHGG
jgi:hypothetical protein